MDDNTVFSKVIKFIASIVASVIAGIIVYVITTGNAPQLFLPPDNYSNDDEAIIDRVNTETNSNESIHDDQFATDDDNTEANASANTTPPDKQTFPQEQPTLPNGSPDENESEVIQNDTTTLIPPETSNNEADIAIDLSAGYILDDVYYRYNFETDAVEAVWVSDVEQVNIKLTIEEPDVTGWEITIGYPDRNFATVITESYEGTVSFSCSPGAYSIEVFATLEDGYYVYSTIFDFIEDAHYFHCFSDAELTIH